MRVRLRTTLRRLRDDSGTNLVEAALIVPLALFLTFAIAEFGMIFHAYLALENGVSEATRYGITGVQLPNLSHEDSIKVAMRQATPTLTLNDNQFTFSHLAVGGNTWLGGAGGPGEIEKVQVDYTWTIDTPLLQPLFSGGLIHLKVDSAMKNERFN